MDFSKIKNIIWDWNGTLLNDVEMCIDCMNQLLIPRDLPKLELNRYREVFTFPVQDYYEKVGIDFNQDPFDEIGHQFMDLYFVGLKNCQLHSDAHKVLRFFRDNGKKQFILSAMEQSALERSLNDMGISEYFDAVFGIDNHLAAGKINRGIQMFKENRIDPPESVLIGDTLHDVEVSDELQIQCVLLAEGHQSFHRLKQSGVDVYSGLSEFFDRLSLMKC